MNAVPATAGGGEPLARVKWEIENYVRRLPRGGAAVAGVIHPDLPYVERPRFFIAQKYAVNMYDHRRMIVDEHSYFNIGSVTKTFTATIQALGNRWGKIETFLPFFADPPAIPCGVLSMNLKDIAVYQSGFMSDNKDPWYDGQTTDTLLDLRQLLRERDGNPDSLPQNNPGSCYSYSNLSWALLGLCNLELESIDDRLTPRWAAAIRRCLGVLGLQMPNTGPFPALGAGPRTKMPAGFDERSPPVLMPAGANYNNKGIVFGGSGNLTSTGRDMYEWLAFHMGYSFNPHSPHLQMKMQGTPYEAPPCPGPTSNAVTTGLGWVFPPVVPGDKVFLAKSGGVRGFTSYVAFMDWVHRSPRPSPVGLFILANSHVDGGAATLGARLIRQLLGNAPSAEEENIGD